MRTAAPARQVSQPLPLPENVENTAVQNAGTWSAPVAAPSGYSGGPVYSVGGLTTYNDVRIANSVNAVLTYLEGTFGALIMLVSFTMAVLVLLLTPIKWRRLSYSAAALLLLVAVGMFACRSLLSTFFNDVTVQAEAGWAEELDRA